MSAKTLVIMCSGLGMGNSTRLLGVVQALRSCAQASPERLRIAVCTNGRAVRFWETEGKTLGTDVIRFQSYGPRSAEPHVRVPWLSFLGPAAAWAYLVNSLRVFSFLRRSKADLALIDSDYHCLPLVLFRVPVFALGQAWDVVRRDAGARPAIRRDGMLVEKLDLLFQRLISERIFAPCFEPAVAAGRRIRPIPLIVRREFEAPADARPTGPILVLLGGSGIGSAPLRAYARKHGLPVIGAPEGAASALDNLGRPLIDAAPAVITQGGLSSISECLARRKKMIVLPIEKHAEQLSNALTVQRLGLGLRALELTEPPEGLLRRLNETGRGSERPWPRTDGARIVAQALLRRLDLAPDARPTSG